MTDYFRHQNLLWMVTETYIEIENLVYELPHELLNDLRLRILGNKEILEKSQIWVELYPSAQSPFQKLNFDNSSHKTRKSRYQTFLLLSSFTGFLYFVPIFWNCTSYTNPSKTIYIDLILTNRPKNFQASSILETGVPDFHRMIFKSSSLMFRISSLK